jgi:metal-responsive CopG/Arc/MetJ family transcriptional regulator
MSFGKKAVQLEKSIDISIDNSHTNRMKTAISIPDHIFEEVNRLARQKKTSRSQIFYIAVEEYLKKVKAQEMFETLNLVYKDGETPEEKLLRTIALEHYASEVLEKDQF